MKIYSQNLHNFMEINRYGQLEIIADMIAKEEIDVIALQEVGEYFCHANKEASFNETNLTTILEKILYLKYNLCFFNVTDMFKNSFTYYKEGLSILSKVKPSQVSSHIISTTFDENDWEMRKVQSIVLEIKNKKIQIINGHFAWDTDNETFAEQWKKTTKLIKQEVDQVIVAGDFNNSFNSKAYKLVTDAGFIDSINAFDKSLSAIATYIDGDVEAGNIDFIFTKNGTIKDAKVLFQDQRVADHLGILVEYKS